MKRNLFNFITVALLLIVAAVACGKDVSVKSVSLDPTSKTVYIDEDPFLIRATVLPGDATNKEVSCKSSNEDVVKVDVRGWVTIKGAGEAKITVTTEDKGKKFECKVKVVK